MACVGRVGRPDDVTAFAPKIPRIVRGGFIRQGIRLDMPMRDLDELRAETMSTDVASDIASARPVTRNRHAVLFGSLAWRQA